MAATVRKSQVRRHPRRQSLLVFLREDFARADRPLRVDRDAGIIFGVKVVGLHSPNTHNVQGADQGTVYDPEALRQAAALYEGVPVNIDHPDRSKPKADRSSLDRFGRLQNIKPGADGLYADLHYLKSHPMAERVAEAAERMPDLFALSHNAYGRGEVREGRYVIHEIPEVRSVDLVADGGTNTSLFESSEQHMKTLREIFEAAPAAQRAPLQKLLEMYEDMGDMAASEPMAEEPQLHDHLGAAILAIMTAVKAGDMDPEAGKKKVLAAYKLAQDEEEVEEDDDKERKVEEDEKEGMGSAKGAGSKEEVGADEGDLKKPTKAQESRRRRAPHNATALTEARAVSLCQLAGIEPAEELLESLQAIGDEAKAIKHLTYLKGLSRQGQRPRTQHVQESRTNRADSVSVEDITDGKSFAALLRRGLN